MKDGLLNDCGVEPDHVAVIVGKLSVVVIVASRMMRFQVPMHC